MEVRHRMGKFYAKTRHGEAELRYDMDDDVMRIYHTFVPKEDRMKGVAGRLTKAAFAFARNNNMKVDPNCEYVLHFVEKNKGYRKDCV